MTKANKTILIFSVILAAVIALVYFFHTVFNPLILGFVLAYIFNPWINYLEQKGIRRSIGIAFSFVLGSFMVFIVLIIIVPLMYEESVRLYETAFVGDEFLDVNRDGEFTQGEFLSKDINNDNEYDPSYLERTRDFLAGLVSKLDKPGASQSAEMNKIIKEAKKALRDEKEFITSKGIDIMSWAVSQFGHGIQGLIQLIVFILLVPVYTVFFSLYMNKLWDWFAGYLPEAKKEFIISILSRIDRTMAAFFRGKMTICVIKAALTLIGLYVFGIKFAVIFALIQLFASMVPYMVLITAVLPALLITLLDTGLAAGPLLSVMAVFGVIEIIEGFVLTPVIMKKELGLHPVVVIIVLMIGGGAMGFFGMLIAVPVAAIVKILWQDWIGPGLKGEERNG